MAGHIVPIGLPTGSFFVDNNGLANYVYDIRVPPGINEESTPNLSLNYSQGGGNAQIGLGWSLGGVDSIQRMPHTLTGDGANAPVTYDQDQARFAWGGRELFSITGTYGHADALYCTEIDDGTRIYGLEQGFKAIARNGTVRAYGITPDSRAMSSHFNATREWYIKTITDYRGNCISYNYTTRPVLESAQRPLTGDAMIYVDSIEYSSNTTANVSANRFVNFVYAERSDEIVLTGAGESLNLKFILKSIAVTIKLPSSLKHTAVRKYRLDYDFLQDEGQSRLRSITEHDANDVALPSTAFTFSQAGASEPWFASEDYPSLLEGSFDSGNMYLMPLNVSGHAFMDIGCVKRGTTGGLLVRTYLARIKDRANDDSLRLEWPAQSASEVQLPTMINRQPQIIATDINSDGRSDLLVPFAANDYMLHFAVAKSNGSGFDAFLDFSTDFAWETSSQFLALDTNGNHKIDVLQIYKNQSGMIAFRVFFFDEADDGSYKLTAAIDSPATNEDYVGTRDWLVADCTRDGVQDLIRIWSKEENPDEILATCYVGIVPANQQTTYVREKEPISLGKYDQNTRATMQVLPCDINGDGVQDLLVCQVALDLTQSEPSLDLTFQPFLCDGIGGFIPQPKQPTQSYTTDGLDKLSSGRLSVTDIDRSGFPTVMYSYRVVDGSWRAVAAKCTASGKLVKKMYKPTQIVRSDQMPTGDADLLGVDVDGTGKTGWLGWSLQNGTYYINPVYNICQVSGLLTSVTDPLGKRITASYKPLSDPLVYSANLQELPANHNHAVRWMNNSAARDGPYMTPLGVPQYVVSQIKVQNVPELNACSTSLSTRKFYETASIDMSGRGWAGFARVHTVQSEAPYRRVVESFAHEWPRTGLKISEKTYGISNPQASASSSEVDPKSLLKIEDWEYTVTNTIDSTNKHQMQVVDRSLHQTSFCDDGRVSKRFGHEYTFKDHNLLLDKTYTVANGTVDRQVQVWTAYSYTQYDDVQGLITAQKMSTVETNKDMDQFEIGDTALSKFTIDRTTKNVIEENTFSGAINAFRTSKYEYDVFGHRTRVTDPGGLQQTIILDGEYNCYPLTVIEQDVGGLLRHETKYAYDARFGVEVSERRPDGSITFSVLDSVGRVTSESINAVAQGLGAKLPDSVIDQTILAPDYREILSSMEMIERTEIIYSFEILGNGTRWVKEKIVSSSSAGQGTAYTTTMERYSDCSGDIVRTARKEGGRPQVWQYVTKDALGQTIVQSPPTELGDANDLASKLSWVIDEKHCTVMAYDALKRPTRETQPVVDDRTPASVTTIKYTLGGDQIDTTTGSFDSNGRLIIGQANMALHGLVLGRQQILRTSGDSGLVTEFTYDNLGQLSSTKDPGGKIELTAFDNQGLLLSTSNVYQTRGVGSTNLQVTKYNNMNLPTEETDATQFKTSWTYDVKGRVLTKHTTIDGRTITYAYDGGNSHATGHLSKVTVSQPHTTTAESTFDFTYDARGRPATYTVTLESGDVYQIEYTYDLFDRLTSKKMPDGTTVVVARVGSLDDAVTMTDGNARQTWDVGATFRQYSASHQLEKWTITGHGQTAIDFDGLVEYDALDRAIRRDLNYDQTNKRKALISERYSFDMLGRLTTVHEQYSGDNATFSYSKKRLASAKIGQGSRDTYEYDDSGNLTTKGDMTLTYSTQATSGHSHGNEIYSAQYDLAGRTLSRTAENATFDFTYNGFGKIEQSKNRATSKFSTTTTDFLGQSLVQKLPDGSTILFLTKDFQVRTDGVGSKKISRSLLGPLGLLAVVTSQVDAGKPLSESKNHNVSMVFVNTKGTITHHFDAGGNLVHKMIYDAFGSLVSRNKYDQSLLAGAGYESRSGDFDTGLIDFGARNYDPLAGRFMIPDDRWGGNVLVDRDVLNRCAFENNDPINRIDPSGHWSGWAIAGVVIGVILVVASLVVTVATFGATTPLVGFGLSILAAALAGAGWAGISYSIANKDEENGGKFVGGYFANVAVGFGVGAITGALGPLGSGLLRTFVSSVTARVILGAGLSAAMGAGASVVDQLAFNGIQRGLGLDSTVQLGDGLGLAAVFGGVFGALGRGTDNAAERGAKKWWRAGRKARLHTRPNALAIEKFMIAQAEANARIGLRQRLLLTLTSIWDMLNTVFAVEVIPAIQRKHQIHVQTHVQPQ